MCHSNARCFNTEGSHVCRCRKGYTGDGKTCTGKFTLSVYLELYSGVTNFLHIICWYFSFHDELICVVKFTPTDMDECETSNGGCEQVCNNTEGSFSCTCNKGYILQDDQKTCEG